MKYLGWIMILMVFVVGALLMYLQRKKSPATIVEPIVTAGPGFDIPTWRILPYDPAKIGQPPVHNVYESPARVRMKDPNRNLLF